MTDPVDARQNSEELRTPNTVAMDRWSASRANHVRWIWLGTTMCLAAALVVGSYVNYSGVANAAATLNRGQADVLEFAQREAIRPLEPIPVARLDSFVRAHRTAGLRYFAILDPGGKLVVSSGESVTPLSEWPQLTDAFARAFPLVRVKGRIRSYFLRPPLAPSASWAGAGSKSGLGSLRGTSYFTVMEFEPVAPALVARAQRALVLAWVGAGILSLATLVFWRTSRLYDEIRQRVEEQRRLAVLGEMSAVLAHEIRNPLASLKGHAQLLTERLPTGSPERRKADRVVDEAKRLEVLTNDLLDFARSGPMNLQSVSPAELLQSCVRDLGEGKVVVDTTAAPRAWLLDEHRFCYAVLANLLRNAVQASPSERPAEARAFAENGSLVFTIRDHGAGLPPGHEQRLFDPFFTTRTTGTGLGLALARRIVEQHGGRISAVNAEDGGALFRVELPANET